jgi:hypothetical protein
MTRLEQLQELASTREGQEKLIARLLEAEKPRKAGTLSLKVGEKGGVSLYGVGRFPVTQYAETWVKILNHADEIKAFIMDNRDTLKFKNGIDELGIPTPARPEAE